MYCTFISLKAEAGAQDLTQCGPQELSLGGEHKLFQAYVHLTQSKNNQLIKKRCISDGGYDHSLIVYQDRATGAFRLHAAVWEGKLRQCPVWTAFGTTHTLLLKEQNHNVNTVTVNEQYMDPNWLTRVSSHKVRLKDLRLFVFCKRYREYRQRRGPAGEFQINFVSDRGTCPCHQVLTHYTPRPDC